MKVLQIIPHFKLAGAESMCGTLCVELFKRGIDVIVVSLYNYHTPLTERMEKEGIRVLYLGKRKGLDVITIVRLFRVLYTEKPDILHGHLRVMPYVMPAAIFCRVKNRVRTVHTIASRESMKLLNYLFYHLNHVVPVALSSEIQRSIQSIFGIDQGHIPIIYNGVDLNKCIIKVSYEQKGRLQYIHIGRFEIVKNHAMLVEAFKKLHEKVPETELVLVGSGRLEQAIKEQVASLELESYVKFIGETRDVFSYLSAADVFVMPSIYEGMPMSIIEAMGTGLPVIASNVGGIPTMISDGEDGLLTEVSVDSILNAMFKLTDVKLREELGSTALLKAQRLFSADVMACKYLQLYKEMVGRKGNSSLL